MSSRNKNITLTTFIWEIIKDASSSQNTNKIPKLNTSIVNKQYINNNSTTTCNDNNEDTT